MSRTVTRLLPLLLALGLIAAAPAASTGPVVGEEEGSESGVVEGDVELLEPCDNPDELEVLAPNGLQSTIEAPTTPLWGAGLSSDSARQKAFLLDLAGQPIDQNTASVTVVMTWDIPVEDYDLNLYGPFGSELGHSENIQPIDGDSETVSGTLRHCDRFTVESLNWTAAGQSTLSLDLSA